MNPSTGSESWRSSARSLVILFTIGWFDTGLGTAMGILVGVIIYANQKDKHKT